MVDFNKINPEEAQRIITALKDGKINATEAKKLGLTPQEAEALNEAFSAGRAEIGDFVLFNKGKSNNGKVQLSSTVKTVKTVTLKSGRKVDVLEDLKTGKHTFQYKAADGTLLKEEYFLKQEGLEGRRFTLNGKGQLVTVKDTATDKEDKTENEQSFLTKAWNKIKKDVTSYGENFSKAWKNSDGFLDTTGALIGATTKTVSDAVVDYAENIEKGVTEITGSETAGTIAKYATGAGIVAGAVEAADQVGDWSADKIREAAKHCTGTNRELLESFADFVEDLNAADIALLFVGGAGAASAAGKFGGALPKILNLLKMSPVAAKAGMLGLGALGAAALTSCSGDEIYNDSDYYIFNLKLSKDDKNDLIALLGPILEAIKNQPDYSIILTQILNTLKDDSASDMFVQDALNRLIELVTNLVEQNNQGLDLGQDIKSELLVLIQQITNGDLDDEEKFNKLLELLEKLGQNIDSKLDIIIEKLTEKFANDAETKELLNDILTSLNNLNNTSTANNELINKTYNLLSIIANSTQLSKEEIKKLLEEINNSINSNGDKIDKTNKLLELISSQNNETKELILEILAKVGTDYSEVLYEILSATNSNNSLLKEILGTLGNIKDQDASFQKEVLNMLAKIQDQDEKFQKNILNAINELGANIVTQLNNVIAVIKASGDTGKNIEALLNKVLEKLDTMDKNQKENAEKIIETINNFKVTGGDVDLSSIEKLLQDLINMTSGNNDILKDINAKMDVLTLTIERAKDEILEKMPDDPNTDAILKKLDEFMNLSNSNSSNILSKMDTIINLLNNIKDSTYDDSELMAKLDEILAAIKDHNVTVNVEGEVTCNCNCGQNHEGIIGDLEDVLG